MLAPIFGRNVTAKQRWMHEFRWVLLTAIVESNGATAFSLKIKVVEAAEVTTTLGERRGNRCETNDEVIAEVGLETVDQADHTVQREVLFHVEV
jgi:hypothetical protein